MMRLLMYSIHDVKAGAYLPPFFMHSDGVALRLFSDSCNDREHAFGKHPEDYTLFCLGYFEDDEGSVTAMGAKQSMGNGVDFKKLVPEPDVVLKEVS